MRVTGEDYARLAERAEQLAVFDGTQAHMRMEDGHCAALQVDSRSQKLVCSAYELRPQVCRDLERGAAACRAERDSKADRPLLALRRSSKP